MTAKSPLLRLDDMRDAIAAIESDVRGLSLDDYRADRRLRWRVERGIEIVSEASRHVPDELEAKYPGEPWRKVAGIGNVLRHEYMDVADDTIWAVIRDHLPALRDAVSGMIEELERDRPG